MTADKIKDQIIQKQDELIKLITEHVIIPRIINGILKKREDELASLRQQLEEIDHSEDKLDMITEIKAKYQTCDNCKYEGIRYYNLPCCNCLDGEKWEPIK